MGDEGDAQCAQRAMRAMRWGGIRGLKDVVDPGPRPTCFLGRCAGLFLHLGCKTLAARLRDPESPTHQLRRSNGESRHFSFQSDSAQGPRICLFALKGILWDSAPGDSFPMRGPGTASGTAEMSNGPKGHYVLVLRMHNFMRTKMIQIRSRQVSSQQHCMAPSRLKPPS